MNVYQSEVSNMWSPKLIAAMFVSCLSLLLAGCGNGSVNLVAKGQLSLQLVAREPGLQTQHDLPVDPAAKNRGTAKLPLEISPAELLQGKWVIPALLKLNQGDEFQLQGELQLSNGKNIPLDQLPVNIENPNPELLQADGSKRLLKALKAGKTTLTLTSPDFPHIQASLKVEIQTSNLVTLLLEIE